MQEQSNPSELKEKVLGTLHAIFDPEIPVNIYDLGLIYDIQISNGVVNIKMTLTAPACPVAGSLPGEVESKLKSIPGVANAKVELVWDPPWHRDKMSDEAKLKLGML